MELMLASAIAAILMAGVMVVVAGLSRDRQRMEARAEVSEPVVMMDVIRRDLANAQTMHTREDGAIVLVGNAGVDRTSMAVNGRLVKVVYRVSRGVMLREQTYLDDAVRPHHWSEVVAMRTQRVAISGAGEAMVFTEDMADRLGSDGGRPMRVPGRVRVRVEMRGGVVEREVVVR
jgi:hypothetical protein